MACDWKSAHPDSSHSSITRVIGQLVDHFGIRLFHRTTRHLSLTDDGENLLAQAHGMLGAVEVMESTLGAGRPHPPAACVWVYRPGWPS